MSKDLNKILKQCTAGDEVAQRQLYLEYRSRWYMTSLRYGQNTNDANDIFQEGLIQIYRDMHQYDMKKSNFSTWSCRVIAHAGLRFLKKLNFSLNDSIDECDLDEFVTVEHIYEQIGERELLELIQKLPPGYRAIFNMYVIEGYKHHEIAEQLNISVGTSKSQLNKAKKQLRVLLEYEQKEYVDS